MTHHRPMRALVTGGAGFIGSHLAERLVARGDDVVILDDLRNSTLDNVRAIASRARAVLGDCATGAALIRDEDFDVVFHLASPAYVPPSVDDPIADLRNNVEQTLMLLESLRRIERRPRFVHVSSAAVYGQPNVQPIREECPPAPVSPYGVDKYCAEEHVRVAALLHGIRATILRYFPVYGPRQRKQVVWDVARKLLADPEHLEIIGTGHELRDLGYVDDVVSATIVAADHAPARGEVFNVGSGRMVTIAHVAEVVARALGADPELIYTGRVRPGDSERMVADISRLRALGYEPGMRFDDGIAATVKWIVSEESRTARPGEGAA